MKSKINTWMAIYYSLLVTSVVAIIFIAISAGLSDIFSQPISTWISFILGFTIIVGFVAWIIFRELRKIKNAGIKNESNKQD